VKPEPELVLPRELAQVRARLVQLAQLAQVRAQLAQVQLAQVRAQLGAESEPAAQHLALVRLRARMTRARGSIPGKPQQQTSINASSGHHLSRKNEPIDHHA